MSLYFPNARGPISGEFATAPGVMFLSEGQALVRTSTDQAAGVLPSTGAATDIFVGFSIASTVGAAFPEPYSNAVESYIVPDNGNVVLQRVPVTGQVGIYDETAGAPVAIGGSGGVAVTGAVISGLTPGNQVTVTYKWALSVLDRVSMFGNEQPGGYVGAIVDQIGYISTGQVYTSEFDSSVNWRNATAVKLAANGQVTDQNGSGVEIPGATIIHVPGVQVPYLGISLR